MSKTIDVQDKDRYDPYYFLDWLLIYFRTPEFLMVSAETIERLALNIDDNNELIKVFKQVCETNLVAFIANMIYQNPDVEEYYLKLALIDEEHPELEKYNSFVPWLNNYLCSADWLDEILDLYNLSLDYKKNKDKDLESK